MKKKISWMWDNMKNAATVTILSGIYVKNIDADQLGVLCTVWIVFIILSLIFSTNKDS